jgi:hypothetical protein
MSSLLVEKLYFLHPMNISLWQEGINLNRALVLDLIRRLPFKGKRRVRKGAGSESRYGCGNIIPNPN